MTPFVAELIGTMFLILLGNGVVANVVLKGTKGNNSGWMVITTGWALSVFAGVVIAGPYSGAHLNPAVTLGLALADKFAWDQVPLFIAAQLLGASDLTVQSIAGRCGFGTVEALRQAFVGTYGVSPTHYRATHSSTSSVSRR